MARIVKDACIPTWKLASASPRPLRIAFLFEKEIDKTAVRKILHINSTMWGGFYNVLLPIEANNIEADWRSMLISNDPDFIFASVNISEELLKELEREIQPYAVWKWNEKTLEDIIKDRHFFPRVSSYHIIDHISNENPDFLKESFFLPFVNESNMYYDYVVSQFGIIPKKESEHIRDSFGTPILSLVQGDLQWYLRFLEDVGARSSPLALTRINLENTYYDFQNTLPFFIVVASAESMKDICLYWNLRMQQNFQGGMIVLYEDIKTPEGIKNLAGYLKKRLASANFMALCSASINKDLLNELKKDLFPLVVGNGTEFIDLYFSNFPFRGMSTREKRRSQELTFENNKFVATNIRPSFQTTFENCRWVLDVDLEDKEEPTDGFIPPKYPGINNLLAGNPEKWLMKLLHGYSIRPHHQAISFLMEHGDERRICAMPPPYELFNSLFGNIGYKIKISDKCKYVQGVTKLFKNLESLKIFRHKAIRELIKSSKSTSRIPGEMIAILRKEGYVDSPLENLLELLSDLVLNRFYRRGLEIHCPSCDLTRWYPMVDIKEIMECAGCTAKFQPSIRANFSYALNELAIRAFDQGTIPVILTILFLKQLADQSFLITPGIELTKDEKSTDIDIVASCDGILILCECKTLENVCYKEKSSEAIDTAETDNKMYEEISDQIRRTIKTAQEIGAPIVFLSTMAETISPELRSKIEELNEECKENIALHILTLSELEKGYRGIPRKSNPEIEDRAGLLSFLPKRKINMEGRILQPGTRKMGF
jgi:hypothetical protein